MYPAYIYALLFVVIPFGIYFLFALVVIYHFRRYSIDQRYARRTVTLFSLGLIAISVLIVVKFSEVNWKRVDPQSLFEDSSFNLFYGNYDRR